MSISSIRSRLGVPQIAALLLLLVFLAQCLWLSAHVPLSAMEGSYVEPGVFHLARLPHCGPELRPESVAPRIIMRGSSTTASGSACRSCSQGYCWALRCGTLRAVFTGTLADTSRSGFIAFRR